jgi:cation transport regulator
MKPYRSLDELPQSLRNELPDLAQRMYLAVYQRTWETCAMGGETHDDELAETAHDAAMLAVKERFDKDEHGQWQQRPVGDQIDCDKLEGTAPDVEDQ